MSSRIPTLITSAWLWSRMFGRQGQIGVAEAETGGDDVNNSVTGSLHVYGAGTVNVVGSVQSEGGAVTGAHNLMETGKKSEESEKAEAGVKEKKKD